MSDLVQRLREFDEHWSEVRDEAADEIAKLRQDETDEAAACDDIIERQAKEIADLTRKLEEARADYHHELAKENLDAE